MIIRIPHRKMDAPDPQKIEQPILQRPVPGFLDVSGCPRLGR